MQEAQPRNALVTHHNDSIEFIYAIQKTYVCMYACMGRLIFHTCIDKHGIWYEEVGLNYTLNFTFIGEMCLLSRSE